MSSVHANSAGAAALMPVALPPPPAPPAPVTGPAPSSRARFATEAGTYGAVHALSQLIGVVKGLVVRRFLAPEVFGFWSFGSLIQTVLHASDFGFSTAASRELPMAHGRRDAAAASRVRSTTLFCTLAQNAAAGVVMAVWLLARRHHYTEWEVIAGLVGVVLSITASAQACYGLFLFAAREFLPLSAIILCGAVIEAVSATVAAYVWGLPGLMGAAAFHVASVLLLFVAATRRLDLPTSLRADMPTARQLLSLGAGLRLADVPAALSQMLAGLWVAKYMSTGALALFAMAQGYAFAVADTTATVAGVYTTRFLTQGAQGVPRPIMAAQLRQFLLVQLLVVMPLMCIAAGIVLPFVISHFVASYAPAIPVLLTLLIVGYFHGVNAGLQTPWFMERRLHAIGVANAVGVIAMAASLAISWFVLERHSLEAVANAVVVAYALYFCYMVIAVGSELWPLPQRVEIVFVVAAAAMWTRWVLETGQAGLGAPGHWTADAAGAVGMTLRSLALIAPVPIYGILRSRVFRARTT